MDGIRWKHYILQRWSLTVFTVFSVVYTQTAVSYCWRFAFVFLTHLFLDESSLSPWHECSPWFFEEHNDTRYNVQNWKLNLPKNHCERWTAEITIWSCGDLHRLCLENMRSLKLRERSRLITHCCQHSRRLWAKSPKYFVHNLFICHFSMNYADLQ